MMLQFGTVRDEDCFYTPVKGRKHQNKKQNQQQTATNTDGCGISKKEISVLDTEVSVTEFRSNLERFLESTTPSVAAQYFSKTTMRGWRTCNIEFQPYFTLGDLWGSFKEWSVYGVGVPLILDGSDCVVQYYVPYLSGIQLYCESTASSGPKSRRVGEDSDGDYYRDSSSDGSSEEKDTKCSREPRGYHFKSEIPLRIGNLSIRDEDGILQEGLSCNDGNARNSQRRLLFEFLEHDTPYSREPLADKILDLSCHYPGLNTLRSCDLLPISWMSVAWYPIYRIPTGPTLKDLDACFLTYHSLCTPIGESGSTQAPVVVYPSELDGVPKISLPVFGMASYKFKGSIWAQNGVSELQTANSLMKAADGWLRSLQVNHPDFQFFASQKGDNKG